MIIKVCGMRQPENIRKIEALGIDWMGFIFFARSPRNVETLPCYMPSRQKRVGVFVNPTAEFVATSVSTSFSSTERRRQSSA